jgi:Ca2+-binding EF-hand superfamily protein
MSQSEKSDLEKNFKSLDKDGDGKLSVEELIEGWISNF